MENSPEESTDGSSIRPVSSLRSHFENMLNAKPTTPIPSNSNSNSRNISPSRSIRQGQSEDSIVRLDGRISLDIPRPGSLRTSPSHLAESPVPKTPDGRSTLTPFTHTNGSRARPISMGPLSDPRSPPLVTVQAPLSPPKTQDPRLHTPTPSRKSSITPIDTAISRSGSPQASPARHFRIPSGTSTPSIEARQTPYLQSTTPSTSFPEPRKIPGLDREPMNRPSQHAVAVPPPINRAGKPKISNKGPSPSSTKITGGSLIPERSNGQTEDRVSPFSTPPSSDEDFRNMKPTPPSIHDQLKPKPITTANLKQESYFAPPPVHHSVAEKRNEQSSYFPANDVQFPPPPKQIASLRSMDSSDLPSDRPGLPPRRDAPVGGVRPPKQPPDPPPPRRSMDVVRPMIPASEPTSKMMPPPRRTQTLNAQVSAASSPVLSSAKSYSRVSSEMSQEPYQREPTNWDENDSDDEEPPSDKSVPALTDYPDSSQANRRPPLFKAKLHEIATKYDTKLFAVCGEYVCTSGFVTRVWSLLTGELLMSSSHGDTVKVTAIAFRPARDVSEEGNRIWLGTNLGEIHEIDIPTQSTIVTRGNAHTRREILKIYRHASEMWSLDDEGKLLVWPPDETGSPNLQVAPYTSRVPRGHTFSIVAGGKLWIATGKEIRIFQRSGESQIFFPVLEKSLVQPNVGDVTSGAIISSQSDRIYFGHTDGKVTIYSRKDYTCLGVTNVSLYKISSLVGAGDYLWAAYNTGMMYVYDTSSVPWKVKKDWRAHEVTIAGLVADRSSIWKLDRFQVLSLGTDNYIRIWDGMLKEDWLEDDMQNHDADFCSFREVTALVMTWNAGASKPTSLRNDERDANFFRDLLKSQEPPDLLVFGFQELVDLEDKKVTAKSFFKSSKKKDALEQEHMSHQYRNWRDHLMRCIDDYMPNSQYTLLRAANLVGLFSCIFVKSSERTKIRDVNAAEVKLGMGGLHGNKGALMVRFILDDSSICFINCHLAAGQTQTVHRNNDIASIMESTVFPPQVDSSLRSDIFVSGGDGSMILDHEICILNGDLNYRIDAMPRNTVINAVRENNLGKLLERDQLLLSRKRNPGFRLRAFQEREITFAPTYKYDVGTDRYDTSEKKRSPAWCDRLLYRGIGRIRQLDYRRHEVRVSDHRPVTGRFLIRVKTISEKHRYAAREACEQRFEELQQRIASDIKLDYLINVFGIVPKEAQKLLSQ